MTTINPNITGETDDWESQISEVLQDGEVIGWICRTPAGFTSLATSRAPREPWAYNYAVGLGAWHAGAMTDFTRRVWHPTGEFTTKRAAVAALTTRKNEISGAIIDGML